jgi:DNA polymerase (family 10)
MGKLRLDQALVLAHMICNKITRHFSKHTPIIVGDLRRGHDLVDSIEILIYPSLSLNKIKTFLGLINTGEITLEKGPIRGCSGINHEQITIKIFSASKIHTGISQILLTGSNKFIEKIIKYSNKDIKELSSIESPSEEGAFKALGLTYIPAELRESHTNLIKLKKHVPVLIQLNDICGTFHNHTLASDGKNTIFEMRQAAINFGLKYISINDHSQSAFYAGGQHPDKLLEQIKEINILNKDSCASACFLLSGVESDIHLNGDLDYENNILEKLDIVVASVHNKLQLNYDDMTQRMVKAASQVYTNIIGHPTGRLLLIREPSTYDLEKLFEACKNNDVAVELNCQPARLDLCDRYLQIAKAYGVMVSINPDAHTIRGFEFLKNGIIIARRAGLTAYDVINTRSLHEIKEWIVKRTKKKK